jgi:hypothetical protein
LLPIGDYCQSFAFLAYIALKRDFMAQLPRVGLRAGQRFSSGFLAERPSASGRQGRATF